MFIPARGFFNELTKQGGTAFEGPCKFFLDFLSGEDLQGLFYLENMGKDKEQFIGRGASSSENEQGLVWCAYEYFISFK